MARVRLAAAAASVAVAWAGVALAEPLPRSAGGPVLREPRPQDHYGFMRGHADVPFADFDPARAPQVPRFRDLDDETFQQLVRDGQPFVVEDCTRGFDHGSVKDLTCEDFAKRWPSGVMRAEYTPGQSHIQMKDPTWYSKIEPQREHVEHMAKDQKIAGPYIWHVKAEEPLETKREVQQYWRTPYFLQSSLANRMEANESFEFWFSMAGGGTFAHADAYCETTISMQFSGTKKWRIQTFPRVKHFLNATAFGDEDIYDGKQHTPWMPQAEVDVGPGQCMIFPMGCIHETFVDPAHNGDGCFTAATFSLQFPRQPNLNRAYLSSFAMAHYGGREPCIDNMRTYATLFSDADFTQPPSPVAMWQEAETLLATIDTNGDQRLTREELYDAFCSDEEWRERLMNNGRLRPSWIGMLSEAQEAELEEEAMNTWAEDTLQYHDVDKDGSVSLEELAQSLLQWNIVQYRLQQMQEALDEANDKPKQWLKRVLKTERAVLQQHYCEPGKPCVEGEELAAHAEALLEDPDALKSTLRRVEELSEVASDSEVTIVDRETGEEKRVATDDIKRGEL